MLGWFKKRREPRQLEAEVLNRNEQRRMETARLLQDIPIQTRRAQQLDSEYAGAIRDVCQGESAVVACYVLDMRRPGVEGQWLLIQVALDEPSGLERIATRLAAALNRFPEWRRTYVKIADAEIIRQHTGAEFYRRNRV